MGERKQVLISFELLLQMKHDLSHGLLKKDYKPHRALSLMFCLSFQSKLETKEKLF